VHCPDRPGLVAQVTDFIHRRGGNIIDLDQHVDPREQVFFMRVAWDMAGFAIARDEVAAAVRSAFADRFEMKLRLHFSDQTPRMAVFVSKLSHCLYDLLSRWQSGEWRVEFPLVVSNHPELEPVADQFGVKFQAFEVRAHNKAEREKAQMALLEEHGIELVVLARYMQVLTDDFVTAYAGRIINIHHSFLPAFPGARPYHGAYERGVKIIGATSHYVTAELDAGPIIEQDVVRVSHKDSVADMVRKGRDLEKIVLSRAVTHHLRREILVYGNRTVVF
jgi:formyltetrahydrofolate deformylase